MNILTEADGHVNGDRQADYSHPKHNFETIIQIWKGLLRARAYNMCVNEEITEDNLAGALEFIALLDTTDVPMLNIGQKLAREMHKHKSDNLVDVAGYAQTIEMLYEKEA